MTSLAEHHKWFSMYRPGTREDRYRYCLHCKQWYRQTWAKPLIRKGGKP